MYTNYNVPIIPQNLRREETIVQIADALQYLSEVTEDIFGRINNRIVTYKKKLSEVEQRITDAKEKIDRLAGEKKAVQVFSSSKYPAAHVNQRYVSIFGSDIKIQPKRTKHKYKEPINTKEEPLEHVEYYHVKTKTIPANDNKGLGKIPTDIKSFGDLLLFNTGKNLYKEYTILDSLGVSPRQKQEEHKETSDIEDAPASITEQTTLKHAPDESYFYSPDLGEVPFLEVPLDLPDLPGIANDLRYENEERFGIAPSVALSSPPDLKKVSDSDNDKQFPSIEKDENETTDLQNKNSTSHVETGQPYVNSAPVSGIINEPNRKESRDLSTTEPDQKQVSSRIVQNENKSITEEQAKINTKELPLPVVSDVHASLMEAIRKAGGVKNAKLRTTKETEKSPKSGGDLMADLHAKLSLRRKGISGTKTEKTAESATLDSNSTLSKLSELIPPPPPISGSEADQDTEDDEWDE